MKMKMLNGIRIALASCLGVVAMLGMSGMARADFINGHQLNLYCSSQNPTDDSICIVYITGAFDAFTTTDLIAQKTNDAAPRFCPDENTGPEDLQRIVKSYLGRPETNLDFAATLLILGAIDDAFACDK